ncbi:MAG: hypothetical protein ABH833_00665 [Parcubacteria group bacterium]
MTLRRLTILLLFILLGFLLFHSFASIAIDIGRHLTLGEIIWDTKSVPDTNMFSYVEPDFEFVNHHWLSEVVFYGIHALSGFEGIIIFKVILLLLTFVFAFFAVKKRYYWPSLIALILSLLIFIERSEARPEIFSFVILGFYLFALFRAKYNGQMKFLWILPVLQLLWVNFHIYFFLGPFLFLIFFLDFLMNRKNADRKTLYKLFAIGILIGIATLINPNGFSGAFEPLNIFEEYGYSVVENRDPFFIWSYVGFNLSILFLLISSSVLMLGLLVTIGNIKKRFFEFIVSAFLIFAAFKMLRNIPIYAIGTLPIMMIVLSDVRDKFVPALRRLSWRKTAVRIISYVTVSAVVVLIFVAVSDRFYGPLGSPKEFGLSIPNSAFRAMDFVKENEIKGQVFNNFDIGGFLSWQLWPEGQVFIDNRPEAYSISFFKDIYIESQRDQGLWEELVDKYDINYVFWNHRDLTEWGQDFIKQVGRNESWTFVYANESILVFVKNTPENSDVISKYAITKENAIEHIESDLEESNEDVVVGLLRMGRAMWRIGYFEPSIYFSQKAIEMNPDIPHGYHVLALSLATRDTQEAYNEAIMNMEHAIELGLDGIDNYVILAMLNLNAGRTEEALDIMRHVEKEDPGNPEVRKLMNALKIDSL